MPQIVFAAQPNGHVDYFNQRWYEYTGIPEGEVGYESWKHVHDEAGLDRVVRIWTESLQTGKPYEIEYRLRRKDGTFRWHLGRARAVMDEEGRIIRWFGTNTDIEDYKQLQERYQQLLDSERAARTEAERNGRMKDEFLATLSHELRTPLNAITGWTQLLRSGPIDPQELMEGLETIERNARAQTQIIDDLLDMSRIISGKVRLEVRSMNLPEVIKAAIDTVRHAADAKGVKLLPTLAHDLPPVVGDSNRLQQVFWNLLANAIKFTPKGGTVRVEIVAAEGAFCVQVIDSGEGIKPEFLPYVFDRFRQADASTTRRHGGLGLGLAIVRQLVELHGGTVSVQSEGAGRGTTFSIHLPAGTIPPVAEDSSADSPRTGRAPAPALGSEVRLTGVKVLVVDDDDDGRALVRRLLEDREASVITASSASHALELLKMERPAVLVSDIGMPEADGYWLIQQIRALSEESGGLTPAVALTAYVRSEDRERALAAGFARHVGKPVEASELLAAVAAALGRV